MSCLSQVLNLQISFTVNETFKDSISNSDIAKVKEWGGDKKILSKTTKTNKKPKQTHTHPPTKQQNPEQQNMAHTTFRNPDHRAHNLKVITVAKVKQTRGIIIKQLPY